MKYHLLIIALLLTSCGAIDLPCITDLECFELTGCDYGDRGCINFAPENWQE